MALNPKVLALINLSFQILLVVVVLVAAYLARNKLDYTKHCLMLRIAIPLQLVATALIMLPAMVGYIRFGQRGIFFSIEMWTHHSLGLAVVFLWVYINLTLLGYIKTKGTIVTAMRAAFTLWVLSLLIGLHMYLSVWT